ncbi:hypothetical protein SAMN04490243_2379 [Robiginitalea myxolifaciens]|uniref:Lysylphosphatidylglycerol synthase TM region n=1 Tax=Robiginitalea myxolifaciens TaxID=400055 RepID=A0A1I6H7X0_9FLAO|nr:lysylphosphatidylglycerol synthase transmembrane domain-containing protein [Robiginitalea myxolifaciens]SFR50458.1 hypothetical protein SAMN04490243_2379 [Robiginitalea myxolifaciens]
MAKLRKRALTALKILISAALLFFVFRQIPLQKVWETLKTSNLLWVFTALILFVVSKVLAAFRLNRYFHEIEVPLSTRDNLKLYLLGMFYNLFLPGGIGGDAYKGVVLHRKFGASGKKLAGVLILDRVSGLIALLTYALILLFVLNPESISAFRWVVPIAIGLGFLIFYYGHRWLFAYLQKAFWAAFAFSALVQLAQLGAAFMLLMALGVESQFLPYLLLFLASSVAAILPISIGGVGLREFVFLYGSKWWGLEEPVALSISLLFLGITLVVSFFGVVFQIRGLGLEGPSRSGESSA